MAAQSECESRPPRVTRTYGIHRRGQWNEAKLEVLGKICEIVRVHSWELRDRTKDAPSKPT